jgi:hypothetical protein
MLDPNDVVEYNNIIIRQQEPLIDDQEWLKEFLDEDYYDTFSK